MIALVLVLAQDMDSIVTSYLARERLRKEVGGEIRELYPVTAARVFGKIRFFWVEDQGGYFVEGAKVTKISHGCPELVSIVKGRAFRTPRLLTLLEAAWFGHGSENTGDPYEHSWGDFGIILTTDDEGTITNVDFWIW